MQQLVLGEITRTSSSPWSMFIFNMDAEGNYRWAKTVGDSQRVDPSEIARDSNGDLVVAGYLLRRPSLLTTLYSRASAHAMLSWSNTKTMAM